MTYRTYQEVSGLDTDTQRHLVQHGDPVERVWAAWALGLALGKESIPALITSLRESPTPGTRRHLLVILTGLGEHMLLRAFAHDDPDDYVRATACQYLVRISPSTDVAAQEFIRERILYDSSSIVRQTILNEAPLEFPALRFEDLTWLAQDADPDIRQAATERLLATASLDQLFPGPLEDRIPQEVHPDLRQRLLHFCLQAGGAVRLLAVSTTVAPERALEILQLLVEAKLQFTWEQLSPLSTVQNPHYDVLLVQLIQPENIFPAMSWLLNSLTRASTWPKAKNRPEAEVATAIGKCEWQATQLLISALPQIETAERLALDPDLVHNVTTHLQKEIHWIEWERDHDEWEVQADWYAQAIHERQRLIAALTKMNFSG